MLKFLSEKKKECHENKSNKLILHGCNCELCIRMSTQQAEEEKRIKKDWCRSSRNIPHSALKQSLTYTAKCNHEHPSKLTRLRWNCDDGSESIFHRLKPVIAVDAEEVSARENRFYVSIVSVENHEN